MSAITNESQLQAAVVLWFSNEFPEYYGSLFEVNNNPKNAADAMRRRAMGLIAGVSDLILIANGTFAGIEIKFKGTSHSKAHLAQQNNWGKHVISQGGQYIMSSDLEEIKEFMTRIILNPDLGHERIEK